jgi:O-antigen/teichoic acid export membrane protein
MVTQYVQITLTIIYGVVFIPLYLKYISTEMYGVWMATGNIMMWFSILMPDWSQLLLQQLGVAYGAEDKEKFSRIFVSGFFIAVIFGILFFVASWSASSLFDNWLKLSDDFDSSTLIDAFLLASAGTALTFVASTFSSVNLALQQTLAAGLINILSMLVRIGVVLIMIFSNYGILALGYGNLSYGVTMLVSNIVVANYNLKYFNIIFHFNFNELKNLINLTFFTSINKFGNTFMKQIDYFLVTRYLGGEATTMLRIIKVVPETLMLFATNTSFTLMPVISFMKGADTLKDKMEKLMRFTGVMFTFSCFLGGAVYAFDEGFIYLWVGESLFAGKSIVFLVVLNLIIAGISDTFGRYVFTIGKIKTVSSIRFILSILQIGLMFIGVIFWGIVGMIIASISVFTVTTGIFWFLFVRAERIPSQIWMVPLRELGIGLIATIIASTLVHFLDATQWLHIIFGVVQYSILFVLVLILISANFRWFLIQVYYLIKKKLNPNRVGVN